jgi:uroporphyrinogen-III decarboxylase
MKTEELYNSRLQRYLTALRNEKPDRVPIRPLVAEFVANAAGFTCQDITHDFNKAFEAVVRTGKTFDWDAMVVNMVWVWTGLTQAIGLKYYGIPGIGLPHDVGFNYIEPSEENAFMRADEYDALIDDPTAFLYNVWLPRVSTEVAAIGKPSTYRNNLALVKGGMAMMTYFMAVGPQIQRMRQEAGTVSAIAGIFKAPLDILADKFRGYIGLTMDMAERPEKVLQACEALMPHLTHVGLSTADPEKQVPIGFWMHRGCVPFVTPSQFQSHYWPTLKPCIEEFWRHGHQTMFYAEGDWDYHLDDFATLPERSIVFHVDRGNIHTAHKKLHHRFAISGGVPNVLLSYGSPEEVRQHCKMIIQEIASEGGYIMDASAIMQNDTKIENLKALTEATHEYGVYSGSAHTTSDAIKRPSDGADTASLNGLTKRSVTGCAPGVCMPWDEKRKELPELSGDQDLLKRIWENIDAMGNSFIWQCLLSF